MVISDKYQSDYDMRCRGIFMAYRTEYKTIIPIRDQLDAIYSEKSLSWNQRVDFAKEVLKNIFLYNQKLILL